MKKFFIIVLSSLIILSFGAKFNDTFAFKPRNITYTCTSNRWNSTSRHVDRIGNRVIRNQTVSYDGNPITIRNTSVLITFRTYFRNSQFWQNGRLVFRNTTDYVYFSCIQNR